MAQEGESLESWLNKATNPSNRQEDWEYIIGFCDQINKELEGPQISVRLLAHKIQSPQEWEAVQALMVLEACMKNCGRRFHSEVGKFRFLNELIKVVSPKYLGDRVSERVKTKVIEMLFGWTVSFPEEVKIAEAYQMLKRQGIVSVDPEMPLDNTLIPSTPPRPKNPVFENEEKSKRLAELLKSKKPEDLQEANRLIKNMVKEDEVRMQKTTKRNGTLEEASNSVKLLNEMLTHFSTEDSTDGDKELIRELYGDCDKLRRSVFQLATETEDNDSNLGAILQASDDLSRVINSYKKVVEEGQAINGEREEALTSSSTTLAKAPDSSGKQSEILIDLVGLDLQSPSPPEQPPAPCSLPADLLLGSTSIISPEASSPSTPSTALSLLDGELFYLGLNDPVPAVSKSDMPKDENLNNPLTSIQASNQDLDLFSCASLPAPASTSSLFSCASLPAPASTSSLFSCASLPAPEFSTSSLFTDSLAMTAAPVSRPEFSTSSLFTDSLAMTAAPVSRPEFSTSSLFTDSLAMTAAPVSRPEFSTSSLFTDSLAMMAAPVSRPQCSSTTASCMAISAPTSSGPTTTDPQPSLGAAPSPPAPLAALSSLSCSPSFSLPSSSDAAGLAPPVAQPQVSGTTSLPLPAAARPASDCLLSHSLQDLAMLDLGSPRNTPGMLDPGGLLGMDETLGATVAPSSSVGVSSSRSSPLPLGVMPGAPVHLPASSQADDSPLLRSLSPILPLGHASPARGQEISLANVVVPLDAIKPSKVCPVTAYDKDGVRVLLHFATDCPPGRPDVLVMVASMLNTAPLPVRNVVLQAAVPKSMKVRLQPPSGTELAPFNPILPPAAITQVMLLANPLKEKVRMRYKLTFTLGEQSCTEAGEVEQFPPAEGWGAL